MCDSKDFDIGYYKARSEIFENRFHRQRVVKNRYKTDLRKLRERLKKSGIRKIRSCTMKIPYDNRAEAQCFTEVIGRELYPYKCEYCEGWHLTSNKNYEKP